MVCCLFDCCVIVLVWLGFGLVRVVVCSVVLLCSGLCCLVGLCLVCACVI